MPRRRARSLLGKLSFIDGLVPALRLHLRALWGAAARGYTGGNLLERSAPPPLARSALPSSGSPHSCSRCTVTSRRATARTGTPR
eukprot:7765118-Alexandrium_andersonii.AAC.1